MATQQPQENRKPRYHDVDSSETRAAYRRNMFLMLAAAVGIALSFAIPSMCPAPPAADAETQELQRNLTEAFSDYSFDAKSSTSEDGEFRCTVYVIAGRGAKPRAETAAFEKLAHNAYGERDGEVVWRFYRQSSTATGGDPAFIGLHRSDLKELARRFDSTGKRN